jgi:hypothetical protein
MRKGKRERLSIYCFNRYTVRDSEEFIPWDY